MAKRSKLYRSRLETIDQQKIYSLREAVEAIRSMPQAKFDETVDIALLLGVDPRKGDQNVRGAVALPHGTGKSVTVAVVAADDAAKQAEEAGADFVGFEDLIAKIADGWLEFDVLIATPAAMAHLRKLGRVLGPRGLMPNPKTGTVTENTKDAVTQAKAGRVEYRTDRQANVHVPVGKVSFDAEKLVENVEALMDAINRAKPATAKGTYIQGCTLASTMSPGIKVDTREFTRI
ncbi:MAG: 50S ribosomal protein L1 [Lentisphaeria bacterium]|nr:50S ribosomal protein L1 [Lentisphaeria bacterium]